MAALVWGLFLTLTALSCTAVTEAASIGADNNVQETPKLPAYDDGFMRKLCTFLGASYVRSVKDPQCWYTWCHAGEPYHMQCPPGRSVSPHFYWSSDDPCTEADAQERCLVGFLKNMHLSIKDEDVKVDQVDETPPLNDKQSPIEGKEAPVLKAVDPVEEPLEVTPIGYDEDGLSYGSRPGTNAEEPIPEPEPTPNQEPKVEPNVVVHRVEQPKVEPNMVVQRVEQEEGEDGVYYPTHRQSHVVDSFTPQDAPYGYFPNYNTYYQHYYSPPSYYPKLPSTGAPKPPLAEHLKSAADDDDEPHTYRTPEGRQAPLSTQSDPSEAGEGMPEEPMYDAEYLGDEYSQLMAASNGEGQEYDTEDLPEYEYVDAEQLAPTEKPPPESPVPEAPQLTVQEEEGEEEEEETEEQGEDEDIVEGGDDGGEGKDPMLYDYFKTHFIEEM